MISLINFGFVNLIKKQALFITNQHNLPTWQKFPLI